MTATASVLRSFRDLSSMRPEITNAQTVYPGAFVGLVSGRISKWTGAAGQRWLGVVSEQVQKIGTNSDGNLGDTTASPHVTCAVAVNGGVLDNVAVTGLAGTVADIDADVYATADDTFTLTAQAAPNATPVGVVVQFKTSSVADVYFYGYIQKRNMDRTGASTFTSARVFRGAAAAASIATAGAGSPSAANLLTGTIVRDCTGASRTDTLPTAALVVAAVQAALGSPAVVGDCLDCLYINGSDPVTEIITIAAGSGGTLDANQTAVSCTILGTCSKLLRLRLTNIGSGTEAYVLYT